MTREHESTSHTYANDQTQIGIIQRVLLNREQMKDDIGGRSIFIGGNPFSPLLSCFIMVLTSSRDVANLDILSCLSFLQCEQLGNDCRGS